MNQIRNYVEAMFYNLPKTKEIIEIKLNMIENLEEKFNELLSSGKNENESIGIILSQFGSIDELKKELGIEDFDDFYKTNNENNNYNDSSILINSEERKKLKNEYYNLRKKTAIYYSIAVCLYILSPLCFLILEGVTNKNSVLPFIPFFSLIATATGIFIYFAIKKSHYTEMLGIKEENNDDNPLSSIIYVIATIIYLFLGFTKGLWHPGWIIFIIASLINSIINYYFYNKKSKEL